MPSHPSLHRDRLWYRFLILLLGIQVFTTTFSPGQETAKETTASTKIQRTIKNDLKTIFQTSRPSYWSKLGKRSPQSKGRDALRKALTEMDGQKKFGAYLIHAETYLTELPPAEDFTYVFWRFLSNLEWTERKHQENGIFSQVAQLATRIPREDEHFYECRFTASSFHFYRGEPEKALTILQAMAEDPQLPSDFLPVLTHRTGKALEALGRWSEAVTTYRKNFNDPITPTGAASAIRTFFIHLQEGRLEEAEDLLAKLAALSTETLATTPGGEQIKSILTLRERDELEQMWQAQEKWLPAFEKLITLLGIGTPETGNSDALPVISDPDNFIARLEKLADAPDPEAFFDGLKTAAQAARWDPKSLNNFVRALLFDAPVVAPRSLHAFRDLVDTITHGFRFGVPEDQHTTALYQCLALLQAGRNKEALALAEIDYQAMNGSPRDAAGQAMLRLWATAVRRTDGDVLLPGKALENLLESPQSVHDRLATVDALARLYDHIGEPGAKESLFQRELTKPAYKSNRKALRGLIERYKASAETGKESRMLSRASAAWIREKAPRWLRFSQPFSIDTIENRKLSDLIEEPSPTYSYLEGAKLRLLAVRDSSLPVAEREQAFHSAIETIAGSSNDFAELESIYIALADDQAFPEEQRAYFGWLAIANAAYSDHKPTIRKLLADPLLKEPGSIIGDALAGIRHLLGCNRMDPGSILSTIKSLSEGPVGSFDLLAIHTLVQRLLALGALEESRTVQSSVPRWNITENTSKGRVQMSLQIGKMIKECSRRVDRNKRLGEIALRTFPKSGRERPDFLHRVEIGKATPHWLTDAQAVELLIYQIRHGLHHDWSYEIWLEVCTQIPHPTPDAQLDRKFTIVSELLASLSKDDTARSIIISDLGSLFDIDSPLEREGVIALISPYEKDPENAPASAFAAALYDIMARLRDGEKVNIDARLEGIEHSAKELYKLRHKLEAEILSQNKKGLEALLASLDESTMSQSTILPYILQAHEILGKEISPKLQALLKKVRDSLLVFSVATGDVGAVYQTLNATKILGDARTLPEKWFEEFSNRCRRTRQVMMAKAYLSEQLEDWKTLEVVSEQGITDYPTYYDFYRFHGITMAKKGDLSRALQSLKTYCRYSKNELDYPAAKALLVEIEAASSPSRDLPADPEE